MVLLIIGTVRRLWLNIQSSNFIQRTLHSTTRRNVTDKIILPVKEARLKPEEVEKDIVLYRQDPTKFYRTLNFFCISQFTLWVFVSTSCYSMKSVPVDPVILKDENAPFWQKINFGEPKYRISAALIAATLGYGILMGGWFYITRSIQYIVLRKGQNRVSFALHTPFGISKFREYPLNQISAIGSRYSVNSVMPIKIQGRRFNFMIDIKTGHFPHPKLFDQTVGTQRKI